MKNKLYTSKDDQFIMDHYLNTPMKRISLMLGRNESSARQRLARLGLSVPKEVAMKFAIESRFKKGKVPPNKDMTMPVELREKIKHTWFPKGHQPHNTMNDGMISTRIDAGGIPYKYIRISKSKWELYHRYVWTKQHGEIPSGMVVTFKDKDSTNCDITNLELISRKQNMQRNSVHKLPEEIKQALRYVAGFNRKINTYVKNN